VTFKQILSTLFPGSVLGVDHRVVTLRHRSAQAAPAIPSIEERPANRSWLDYELRAYRSNRVPIAFASRQLYTFLKDQVYGPKNYIASWPGDRTGNMVGPLAETNLTVRELLNLIISRSSAGGIWVVKGSQPQSEPLWVDEPFWRLLPYGGTLGDFLSGLRN
jgi:hypothetical protein